LFTVRYVIVQGPGSFQTRSTFLYDVQLRSYEASKLHNFRVFAYLSHTKRLKYLLLTISVAVCEIFSVKEWCDLKNRVRVCSRSLKIAPFDRSHTSSYSPSIELWRYLVSITKYSDLLVENREFFISHLYSAPPQGVTPSEFRENVWC